MSGRSLHVDQVEHLLHGQRSAANMHIRMHIRATWLVLEATTVQHLSWFCKCKFKRAKVHSCKIRYDIYQLRITMLMSYNAHARHEG